MKLIKVYGHPRSGNHFLLNLIHNNFYPSMDLKTGPGAVGHWSDRVRNQISVDGRLAGGHGLPQSGYARGRAIYIYRDGRDVAVSVWKSPHFKHKSWNGMPFSQFLGKKLDWYLTPGRPSEPGMDIAQHWVHHLVEWGRADVLKVQYEKLVTDTDGELDRIAEHFKLERPDEYKKPGRLVGWFPSGSGMGGWKKVFNEHDLEYFMYVVPRGFYGLWDGE